MAAVNAAGEGLTSDSSNTTGLISFGALTSSSGPVRARLASSRPLLVDHVRACLDGEGSGSGSCVPDSQACSLSVDRRATVRSGDA